MMEIRELMTLAEFLRVAESQRWIKKQEAIDVTALIMEQLIDEMKAVNEKK